MLLISDLSPLPLACKFNMINMACEAIKMAGRTPPLAYCNNE